MNQNEILVIGNFLLYFVFTLYIYNKRGLSIGVYLLILYAISSLSSIFYVMNPLYKGFVLASDMTIEPYLFLFINLALLLYPVCSIKPIRIRFNITANQQKKIIFLVNIIIFMQIVCLLLIIPDLMRTFNKNDLAASREIVYGGDDERSITLLYDYKITKYFDLILGGVKPYIIFISFYIAFINKIIGKKGLLLFVITILYAVIRSSVIVSRGELVFLILYLIFTLLIFKKQLNEKILKKITMYGVMGLAIFIPFFWAVSVSRFGDLAEFYIFRYAGESMCNFNGNMYEKLTGTIDFNIYFPLFAIGQNFAFTNTLDKWELIMKQSGVSGQFFYTIIGGFMFCFGKIGTLISCFIINRGYNKVAHLKFNSLLHILPLCLFSDMMIRGIFFFPLQGIDGNVEIIMLFILMLYLKK